MAFLGSIGKFVEHTVQQVIKNPLQAGTLIAAGPFAALAGGKIQSAVENIIHPAHAPTPSQVVHYDQQTPFYQPIAQQAPYQQYAPQPYYPSYSPVPQTPYGYGGQQSWAYSTPSPVYSTPQPATYSAQPDRSWETLAEGLTLFL